MADAARTRKNLSHRSYSPRQLDDQSEEHQALLDEARAGSSDAHGKLLDGLRPKMVGYFAQRLSSKLAQKASEQDLAQEVCLQAVKTFAKQFRGATVAEYWGWLMAICRNVLHALERMFGPGSDRDLSREELLDELRLAMESQHPYARRQPTPDETLEALETAGQLQAALATLSDQERTIVTARHHDGLSLAAIARSLGKSKDWVERTYKRCLLQLKRWLGREAATT